MQVVQNALIDGFFNLWIFTASWYHPTLILNPILEPLLCSYKNKLDVKSERIAAKYGLHKVCLAPPCHSNLSNFFSVSPSRKSTVYLYRRHFYLLLLYISATRLSNHPLHCFSQRDRFLFRLHSQWLTDDHLFLQGGRVEQPWSTLCRLIKCHGFFN